MNTRNQFGHKNATDSHRGNGAWEQWTDFDSAGKTMVTLGEAKAQIVIENATSPGEYLTRKIYPDGFYRIFHKK